MISNLRSNVIFLKQSNRVVINFDLVEGYSFPYDPYTLKSVIEFIVSNDFDDRI